MYFNHRVRIFRLCSCAVRALMLSSSVFARMFSQFRQPEHTGENRCIPCTIANVAIAAIGSAVLVRRSKRLGAWAFVVSLGTIHLRGYLVPGTPALTKWYVPDRLLRWFEHEPSTLSTTESGKRVADASKSMPVDPEGILLEARAVTPCEDDTDLCLTTEFEACWREQQRTVRDRSHDENTIREMLDTRDDRIVFEQYGDALLARAENDVIGQWPTTAAVVADVASAAVLAQRYPEWTVLTPAQRVRVLTSLRVFLDTCPLCDGPVRIGQDVVESCCRSYDVVRVACQNCDTQLFEIEWDNPASDTDHAQHTAQTEPIR